ncbi:unnamed protein product [Protopolystoma xenopodis]|uniref:Uncharacterized protein n=1 Tax=Protopolystoma xenopodis TaxID=117903 RepID=A0A3S5BQZ1_9PLAT|nr:unnamed protein product [Protopolystoma xenopodis]
MPPSRGAVFFSCDSFYGGIALGDHQPRKTGLGGRGGKVLTYSTDSNRHFGLCIVELSLNPNWAQNGFREARACEIVSFRLYRSARPGGVGGNEPLPGDGQFGALSVSVIGSHIRRQTLLAAEVRASNERLNGPISLLQSGLQSIDSNRVAIWSRQTYTLVWLTVHMFVNMTNRQSDHPKGGSNQKGFGPQLGWLELSIRAPVYLASSSVL